ncbi:phage major capsid protein, partial [Bacillus pseudomycoides]
IAAIFKSATAKPVTGLDGIVTLFNTGFKNVYNVKAYVSSSLFNALDLLKDKNGRFLLQDDITLASGKRIKGKEVVVLDDDIIGT